MIVDLFAGPGGWSEGLRLLDLADIGLEWDASACATRRAAGHLTIRADVESYPCEPFAGRTWGLIASPPCPDFSAAGKRAGIDGLSGRLIRQVPRWVEALRPEWVACEQVPGALPWWKLYAHQFGELGYSTWAGVLCAADYGVPQTRNRTILLASRVRRIASPEPTHAETPGDAMFGQLKPWVSMADALGWGDGRPWPTIPAHHAGGGPDGIGGSGARNALRARASSPGWVDRRTNSKGPKGAMVPTVPVTMDRPAPTMTGKSGGQWVFTSPATTVAGDPRITARCHHDDGSQGANAKTTDQVRAGDYEGTEPVKLTPTEALILQSFRPDYPVQGTKTKQFEQIGNAVPPLLAAHVLAAVTGRQVKPARRR